MLRDVMYDAQSVPEAYGLALLAALQQPMPQGNETQPDTRPNPGPEQG